MASFIRKQSNYRVGYRVTHVGASPSGLRGGRFYPTGATTGNCCHVAPSSTFPRDFGLNPPHCLKKKGVPDATHWSRMSSTHSELMSLAFGPLSPPTITHDKSARYGARFTPRNNGSQERNRTAAGTPSSAGILASAQYWFSTETPSHMFSGHGRSPAICARRSCRFVSTWNVCEVARDITSKISAMYSKGTSS